MKILIRLIIVAVVVLVVIGIATSGTNSQISQEVTEVTPLDSGNQEDDSVSQTDNEEDNLEALIDTEVSDGIVILGGDGIPNN